MPDTYFVRHRGRTTGPHDVPGLQKLVRRGLLTRVHEISSDRRSWAPAGEFEDLFPSGGEAPPPPPPPAAAAQAPAGAAPSPASSPRYYYAQSGATVGPVPVGVLRVLAQNGTLRPEDPVWKEGDHVAVAAAQVTVLAADFSALGLSSLHRPASTTSASSATAPRPSPILLNWMASLTMTAQVSGILVGGMILLLLNLPLFAIGDRVVWWWTLLNAPGSTEVVVYCFFLLFGGLALCLVSSLTKGLARGISFLSIVAATALFTLVVCLAHSELGLAAFATVYFLPALVACVVGLSQFRPWAPGNLLVRILQCVAGGLCAALALGITIYLLAETSGQVRLLPGILVFAFVLQAVATIGALAAGIVAIVASRPVFSRQVNVATVILAMVSLACAGVAQILVAAGLAGEAASLKTWNFGPSMGGALFFLIFRFTVVEAGILWLLVVGWLETLAATHCPQAGPTRPQLVRIAN